jgi:hypothetical protein
MAGLPKTNGTINPVLVVETTPFDNYDGTRIGVAEIVKNTEGKSALSAFANAENYLHRLYKDVVNDMKKENPTVEEGGPAEKKKNYKDMFNDYKEKYNQTDLSKLIAPLAGGKKKLKRKTKKPKKRSRRSKKNKK